MLGPAEEPQEQSFYAHVGGHETFAKITEVFFEGVKSDPDLRAMYQHDLDGAQVRLCQFLEQYWGGPMTYSQTRGAPRLKMRHMPWKVTPRMRDRWTMHMHTAISSVHLPEDEEYLMRDYIERAADFLINADDVVEDAPEEHEAKAS